MSVSQEPVPEPDESTADEVPDGSARRTRCREQALGRCPCAGLVQSIVEDSFVQVFIDVHW
jgi:hypothetical protein